MARIRAVLRVDSPVLRHAARLALVAFPVFAVTLLWPLERGYWMTIALLLTLQPGVALTLARAAERIGGTLLGAAIGALLTLLLPTQAAMAAALFLLAIATAALRRVSYGAFIAGATAVIVVLLEQNHPGQPDGVHVALLRAGWTLLGGGLALAAAMLLWPDWTQRQVGPALRKALVGCLAHGEATLASLAKEAPEQAVLDARRQAGGAINATEILLQRSLLEHAGRETPALRRALGADAAIRRAAGRIASLRLVANSPDAAPDAVAARAWRDWFARAARAAEAGAATLPPRPADRLDEPADAALAAIAAQVEIAAEELARLAGLAEPA